MQQTAAQRAAQDAHGPEIARDAPGALRIAAEAYNPYDGDLYTKQYRLWPGCQTDRAEALLVDVIRDYADRLRSQHLRSAEIYRQARQADEGYVAMYEAWL